jgi:hypothetical protein
MFEVLTPEPTAGESGQTAIDQLAAGMIGVVAVTAVLASAGDDIMGEIQAVMRDPVQSAPAA